MTRFWALARAARQSNRSHDRLARRAIGHLREGAPRAAVVNAYFQGIYAQPGPGEFIIETFADWPLVGGPDFFLFMR